MAINELFDLVRASLPRGFDADKIKGACPVEAWLQDSSHACKQAVASSPWLDWNAYLAENSDVKEAGVDPAAHFLEHGVFEGRKLHVITFVDEIKGVGENRPKVSVIMPNYNDADHIGGAIASARAQTLSDIEIIVADDGSTDASPGILRGIAAEEPRLKLLESGQRQSQHMARKKAVEAASGRYIMFLDADDALAPNACELAYAAVATGWDIVCFNAAISAEDAKPERIASFEKYINRGADGCFEGIQILENIFHKKEISDLLWNKIYEANLCKRAFREMPDGFHTFQEDIYETFALASKAKNLKKIPDKLYVYRLPRRSGPLRFSASSANGGGPGDIWKSVSRFLEKNDLRIYRKDLEKRFLDDLIANWASLRDPKAITEVFNKLAINFGAENLVTHIVGAYFKDWIKIARVFRYYEPSWIQKNAHPRTIGVLYEELYKGDATAHVMALLSALNDGGYDIVLFLEKCHPENGPAPDFARVAYAPLEWYGEMETRGHIFALGEVLKQNPVDAMICPACWNNAQLWQTMLLRHYGVPVIFYNLSPFYERFVSDDMDYDLKNQLAVFHCADKLICQSHLAESFYRINGIDAKFIQPYLDHDQSGSAFPENVKNRIVVGGKISDRANRQRDALRAIAEMVKARPQLIATFIGEFESESARADFYDLLKELELESSVRLAGGIGNSASSLRDFDLFLFTGYAAEFPGALAATQAAGVPCVMYDLPIPLAESNLGIIRVEHGDYKTIAKESLRLLDDRSAWKAASKAASAAAARFSRQEFAEELDGLLLSFRRQSDVNSYDLEHFQELTHALDFYARSKMPWR